MPVVRLTGVFLIVFLALGLARIAGSQENKEAAPSLALSCTMESPENYRNHVVSIAISEQGRTATVQGRVAKELTVEYLRFVIVEDKIRWTIDRGTGRISMFVASSNAPVLYGTGACVVITNRKF